jgi:two-component system sensor histidine kinase TtrS
MKRWEPTYATYLNETVGKALNISFEAVPMNFAETFDLVGSKAIDFIYTNPSAFSCVESEYGVAPIVSLRNFRKGFTLNQFGGTIFTRSNRTDINTIHDLRDKIVEAVSITGLGACQMQWRLMIEKGINFLVDPAQVVFAFNQKKIVRDVIAGNADVGFVRTDMAEGMDSAGEINISDIKVIEPIDLGDFPFPSSTILYPEWCLGALPHTSTEVSTAVAQALMQLNSTHYAAKAGSYSTWDAPLSYMPLRDMQQALVIASAG